MNEPNRPNETARKEPVLCDVCDRPIDHIERLPFRIEAGDCIYPETEMRLKTSEELITGLFLVRHDE